MVAVEDRGHKVRKRRIKDQNQSSSIKHCLSMCDSLDFHVANVVRTLKN